MKYWNSDFFFPFLSLKFSPGLFRNYDVFQVVFAFGFLRGFEWSFADVFNGFDVYDAERVKSASEAEEGSLTADEIEQIDAFEDLNRVLAYNPAVRHMSRSDCDAFQLGVERLPTRKTVENRTSFIQKKKSWPNGFL